MTEKNVAQVGRVRRTPIAQRNKLSVENQDPNYRYRVVTVDADRIQDFIDRGYELVNNAKVGDKRVDSASPLGSSAQISLGGGAKGVVMRQRKDWYDEDQAAKQAQIDELEQSMTIAAKKGV